MNVFSSTQAILSPEFTQQLHTSLVDLLNLALLALTSFAAMGIKLWMNSMNSGWKKVVAERAVKYVEQKLTDGSSQDKFNQAAKILSDHFPRISQEEVAHLIEASVLDLTKKINTTEATVTVSAPPPQA